MALTKFNYNSFDVTPVASKAMGFNSDADGLTSISPSSMILIKTLTASSDSDLSFVNGTSDVVLDSTYPIYVFKCINMHPATDDVKFQVNFRDGGSSYDATKTSTHFRAQHSEAGTSGNLAYRTDEDLAQSTGVQMMTIDQGNANDEACSGELWLFNPSSTTYVKHFMSNFNIVYSSDYTMNSYVAGYCNVTAAIDGAQFTFDSGNIDAGTIKLYGIKDS